MYSKNSSSGRGQSSSHRGHTAGHSNRLNKSGRPMYSGRPTFGSRRVAPRRGHTGDRIDPSRFINKANPTVETEVFVPTHTFKDFNVADQLKAAIIAKGYVTPTPIQDQAIPHVLNGADV